jgi:hypothetical protein
MLRGVGGTAGIQRSPLTCIVFGLRSVHLSGQRLGMAAGHHQTDCRPSRHQWAALCAGHGAYGSCRGQCGRVREHLQGARIRILRWPDCRSSCGHSCAPTHACGAAHRKTPSEIRKDLVPRHSGRGHQDPALPRVSDFGGAVGTHRSLRDPISMPNSWSKCARRPLGRRKRPTHGRWNNVQHCPAADQASLRIPGQFAPIPPRGSDLLVKAGSSECPGR